MGDERAPKVKASQVNRPVPTPTRVERDFEAQMRLVSAAKIRSQHIRGLRRKNDEATSADFDKTLSTEEERTMEHLRCLNSTIERLIPERYNEVANVRTAAAKNSRDPEAEADSLIKVMRRLTSA